MKCSRVRDMMMDYVSEETSAADAELIRTHLAGCTACRRERELAREACAALAALRADEPAPELIHGVRRKLGRDEIEPHAMLRPWPALSSAALVCTLIAACWILMRPEPPREITMVSRPEKMQAPTVTQPPRPVIVDPKPETSYRPRQKVAAADSGRRRPMRYHATPAPRIRRSSPMPEINLAVTPRQPESLTVMADLDNRPDSPRVTVVRHFDVGGNVRSVTITDKAEPAGDSRPDSIIPGSGQPTEAPFPDNTRSEIIRHGGNVTDA